MTNTTLFKIKNHVLFSIFILLFFQSCNSNKIENDNYDSEKILIERLQLDCYKQFKKSEQTYNSIKEIQHDPANEPLALLAAKQMNIADTLDISLREIIALIEEMKWFLITEKNNPRLENKNGSFILPYERFAPLRPIVIDFKYYDFVPIESRSDGFNDSIKNLEKRIKTLREKVTKLILEYYDLNNAESLEINQLENFTSYENEFNSLERADKRSNEYLCGSGELRRLEQIDLELIFKKHYWLDSYSTKTSSPTLFCHLINLQSDLLNTRNMIFELMSLNLHCEYMKMSK